MNGERDEWSVILCPISFGLFELFELPNSISGISSISQELLGLFKFIEVIDFSRVVSSYSSYSFEFSNRIGNRTSIQFELGAVGEFKHCGISKLCHSFFLYLYLTCFTIYAWMTMKALQLLITTSVPSTEFIVRLGQTDQD